MVHEAWQSSDIVTIPVSRTQESDTNDEETYRRPRKVWMDEEFRGGFSTGLGALAPN